MPTAYLSDFFAEGLFHPDAPGAPVRIDWIGEVRPQTSSDGRPAFELPLLLTAWKYLSPGKSERIENQAIVWQSVDFLPSLTIGSVWKKGRRMGSSQLAERVRLRVLVADRGMTLEQRLTLDDGTPTDEEPIPRNSYRLYDSASKGYVANTSLRVCDVQTERGERLEAFIPAIELARFYACPNSLLARALFAGMWPELEWEPGSDSLIENGQRVEVIGQQNIAGLDYKSAFFQARYKRSPQMNTWVNRAGKFLQLRGFGQNNSFEFGFPFRVPDVLPIIECEAVRLRYKNKRLADRYLVTRILRCDAPFPFDVVKSHPLMHPGKVAGTDPAHLKPMSVRRFAVGSDDGSVSHTRNYGGNEDQPLGTSPGIPSGAGEYTTLIDTDERFGWLDNRKVELVEKNTQKFFYAKENRDLPGSCGDGVSTNTPRGQKGPDVHGGVNTQNEGRSFQVPSLDVFLRTLDQIGQQKPAINTPQVTLCSTDFSDVLTQQAHAGHHLINLRLNARRDSRWQYVVPPRGRGLVQDAEARPRHLVVAQLVFDNGAHVLLAELEHRKPKEFCVFACDVKSAEIDVRDLVALLVREVVEREHWPEWNSQPQAWKIGALQVKGQRILHCWDANDTTRYAERVLRLSQF